MARMSDAEVIQAIKQAVTIPVMAKARIGHFVEAQILEALEVDYIDESEVHFLPWALIYVVAPAVILLLGTRAHTSHYHAYELHTWRMRIGQISEEFASAGADASR